MSDVVRDIRKNVGRPIVKMVDDNQKKLRKGVAKLIDVSEENKKSTRPIFEDNNESPETEETLFSLESLRHWDVTMPPVKKKRFGIPVPGVKNTINKVGLGKVFHKKRRITIELYKKITREQAAKNKERDRRVFKKLYSRASMVDTSVHDITSIQPLEDEDQMFIRILKEKKSGVMDWHDDDSQSTASHLPNGALESHNLTTYNVTDYGDGNEDSALSSQWKERHRFRLSTIEINNIESRVVELVIGVGVRKVEREIRFENPHEAETFVQTFDKMTELMLDRGSRQAAEQRMNMGNQLPSKNKIERSHANKSNEGSNLFSSLMFGSVKEEEPESNVNLLIEIVSASNLAIAGKEKCFITHYDSKDVFKRNLSHSLSLCCDFKNLFFRYHF